MNKKLVALFVVAAVVAFQGGLFACPNGTCCKKDAKPCMTCKKSTLSCGSCHKKHCSCKKDKTCKATTASTDCNPKGCEKKKINRVRCERPVCAETKTCVAKPTCSCKKEVKA